MMKVRVDFSSPAAPAQVSVAWSLEQLAIFKWFETGRGNLVVRARAGTGKTTTILEGVNRAPEQKILLAAFNKSIATELTRRVKNPAVEAKTLHGLGFSFVRRAWQGVCVDSYSERAEKLARRACPSGQVTPDPIVRAIRVLHTKAREMSPFATVTDLIELAARFDLLPDSEWDWTPQQIAEAARRAMDYACERSDSIDFADMTYLPLVLNLIRPWYNMVVVDEAQDMTEAQLSLATRACKRDGRIAIVGDDRQAIYAFRGADSGSLDRLKNELNADELGLKTTYRCPKSVVAVAATIVSDFLAAPSAPVGSVVNVSEEKMTEQATEGDFILSRTNAPLVHHCMSFLKAGRRARIKGRDIGKGIVALIRRLRVSTPVDLAAKVASWTTSELERTASMPEGAAEVRSQFLVDQRDLIEALSEGVATVAEIIARAESLFTDDAERGSIMLSTVHKAKGLEASKVYLLTSTFRGGKMEEDNIRYVAITRSKGELFWVADSEA